MGWCLDVMVDVRMKVVGREWPSGWAEIGVWCLRIWVLEFGGGGGARWAWKMGWMDKTSA